MTKERVIEILQLNTSYFPFTYSSAIYYGADLKVQQVVKENELNDEWKAKYKIYYNQISNLFNEETYFIVGYFYEVINPHNFSQLPNDIKRTIKGFPKYPCVLAATNRNSWIRIDSPSIELKILSTKGIAVVLDISKVKYETSEDIEPQDIFITDK